MPVWPRNHQGDYAMNTLLARLGTALGIIGILTCLTAGLVRLSGAYYLSGYSAQSLLMIGIASIIIACFFKLEYLSRQSH